MRCAGPSGRRRRRRAGAGHACAAAAAWSEWSRARRRRRCDAGLRPIVLRPARPGWLASPRGLGGPAIPTWSIRCRPSCRRWPRCCGPDRPRHLELHHLLGHDHAVAGLAARLRLNPIEPACTTMPRFCPASPWSAASGAIAASRTWPGCEDCVADLGSLLERTIAVPELLARSAAELARAAGWWSPSRDAAHAAAAAFSRCRAGGRALGG